MASNEIVIAAENLGFSYGNSFALQGVTLGVPRGAVGLLGPNGAGKTTLIKLIMGFLPPARGKLSVFGLPIPEQRLRVRLRMGWMPEMDFHIPEMNAVEFVSYGGQLCGMERVDALQRAHEVLYYVGVEEARYRKLETFSTGMKQRVKLAQALIHDPQLLLLDEPTNGLDPEGREEMLDLVRDIGQRKGMTLVLSSHLLPDVESVCTDVLVMDKGKLVLQGNIESLKKKEGRLFEVRVQSGEEGFLRTLREQGAEVADQGVGRFRLTLQEGLGTDAILKAAVEHGCELRYLREQKHTLEEVFLEALERKGA